MTRSGIMPLSLANGVCAANVPIFLRHSGCQDLPKKTLPSLRFASGKGTLLFCVPNSPRRYGIGGSIRRRKLRAFVKPERVSAFSSQPNARDTGDLPTFVLDKEADESETSTNSSGSTLQASGRRRVEVVGKDIELEKELGLSKDTGKWYRNNPKKPTSTKRKNKGLDTQTSDTKESESADTKEVQLRSRGDAANLAQSEVTISNGASDVALREHALSGQEEENSPTSVKEGEGLVPFREQWPMSLSELSRGGQLVADLTTAWDGLAGRLASSSASGKNPQHLLAALKLALSAMQQASRDRRLILTRSLAVAYTLADLQMDVGVMAAGLLQPVVEAGLVGIQRVEQQLGSDVSRLLHDCMRFKRTLDQMDILDEESARAVRQFCLSYHDIRAISIEFSARLHQMRHLQGLPRYQQQILALEALQIHAPLAHAIGTKEVSSELEDLAFKVILPDSYESLDRWLRSHWPDGNSILEESKQRLSDALEQDEKLGFLLESFTISGRLKSRFSTMKKLLKDGRKPEDVYDIMGIRIVVSPKPSLDSSKAREREHEACYRVLEVVRSIWTEVSGRFKDYIAKPKSNGYESLHVAVYLADAELTRPSMELQIRTSTMDSMASGGDASHSLYKGGLTDPEQVQQLKKLMMAAAERAAFSLKELTGEAFLFNGQDEKDHVFMLFDKNSDGEISMAEFEQVMGELGADENQAHEVMQLVDTNKDGFVSADEFAEFKKKVHLLQGFDGFDKQFSSELGWKLRDSYTASGASGDGPCDSDQSRYSNASVQNDSLDTISIKGCGMELIPPMDASSQRVIHEVEASGLMHSTAEKTNLESKAVEYGGDQLQAGLNIPVQDLVVGKQKASFLDGSASINLEATSRVSSLGASNDVEKIRMERIENSSKSSTSTSTSKHERSVKLLTATKNPLSLSRPVYTPNTPNTQYTYVEEPAGKQDSGSNVALLTGEHHVNDGNPLDEDVATHTKREDRRHDILQEGLKALRHLIAGRKIAAAHELAKQLYKDYPGDTNVLVQYAFVERQCGDLVAAGSLYSQAIRMFEAQKDLGYDYVRTLQAWGSIEVQARNANRARALFMDSIHAARQAEVRFPGMVSGAAVYGLHAWARLEEQLGNWSKAQLLLTRAAEIQPRNAVVHQSRALLEARAHNYGAARHHFRLAVEAAPDDVKCWHAWAVFEGSQGKRAKMRRYFKHALKVDPSSVHTLQAWAYQESLIGTAESRVNARILYQRCTEIDPENVFSWQAWAVMEQALGNYDKARDLFENGLRVNPICVATLQAFAHMERTLQNLGAAKKILEQALKVEPENAAVLMEAALVEESLGNIDVAQDLFKLAGMADKRKSRVRHRMFVSRKAVLLGKTAEWDSKNKRKGDTNKVDTRVAVKARKLPSRLTWEGKAQTQQVARASIVGA